MTADTSKLSTATIVDAAIAVADDAGIGSLSMRRVAEKLGVGAMSLYRHVEDKDALLQAMSTEVGRRFPYPVDTAPEWRTRVGIAVDVDWDLYTRHPWVVLAYSSPRHSYGEDSLACLDWLAAGFLELGVGIERATDMALSVWSFVHGVALVAVSDQLLHDDALLPSAGLAEVISGESEVEVPSHLARLAGRRDAGRLLDPRARLDAGIEYLCLGFAASAV
ncbi:TetR/AcrR family transcriptional regulator [Gordonia sp. WA4-43]|uniref:TetR/AcrR family transcriptional regulator n=1 Tax=Gordonia sp. WA4-43 TaxID=2878678 RepID=UPI001CFC1FA9|nr:TetR/AcrR family transcriptional regulator [Gordonia sp. WA4-43]UCZ88799.1 TetR/AcrR family transcriptional regulator; helix-turn-helix transcriptional regulator [Gordonia sp. WA4-43]